MSSAALALVADARPHMALIHPVLDAAGVMQVHDAIAKLVKETLVDGKDFGIIPGTNKPSLYKSGAERLCVGFGLVDTYDIVATEVDHHFENYWEKRKKDGTVYKSGTALGLYSYTVKCFLRRREDNVFVSEGVGYCTSLETKYCDRPRDVANTILKMAKKRAKVDATLSGLGLSDRFTQDTEDQDRDTEDENGQRTSRPAGEEVKARAAPDVSKMTLEQARKITLRGKEGSWGGAAKKPLAEAPYSVIKAARLYFADKLNEKPDDLGLTIDVRALELVEHDMRQHDEAKQAAESKGGADSAPASGASQDSPARKSSDLTSPAPAAAPLSLGDEDPYPDGTDGLTPGQLKSKALELLKHPSMNDAFIAGTKQQLTTGLSDNQLRATVRGLQEMIAAAPAPRKKGEKRAYSFGDLPGDPA